MNYKIMLSYSWKDSAERVALSKHLESIGGVTVLFDRRNIGVGAQVHPAISDILSEADCLVALLTQAAISSKEVLDEITRAHERGKHIIPIVADDTSMESLPWFIRDMNYIKYSPTDFDRVLGSLELAVRKVIKAPAKPIGSKVDEEGKEMMRGLFDKIFDGSRKFLTKIIEDVVRIQNGTMDAARKIRKLRIYLETEIEDVDRSLSEDVDRSLSKEESDTGKKEFLVGIANALGNRAVKDKRKALQAALRVLTLREAENDVDGIFDEVKDTVHFFLAEQAAAGDAVKPRA